MEKGDPLRNLSFSEKENRNTHKENKSSKTKWDTTGHDCSPVTTSVSLPCVPVMAREVDISLTLLEFELYMKMSNEPKKSNGQENASNHSRVQSVLWGWTVIWCLPSSSIIKRHINNYVHGRSQTIANGHTEK